MKTKLTKTFWILVVVFLLLQLKLIDRTNPPVTGTIEAPDEVMSILRRSCFDCHSNETVWPWYSYVAPFSWLIEHDVVDGRKHLNFSVWDTYSERRKNHKIKECGEEVEEGKMPLWFYMPLHPEAELLPEDKKVLLEWSNSSNSE